MGPTAIYTLSLHDALPIYFCLPAAKSFSGAPVKKSRRSRNHAASLGERASFSSRELRSEEHTSELQSRLHVVCRPLLEKKNRPLRRLVAGHLLLLTATFRP